MAPLVLGNETLQNTKIIKYSGKRTSKLNQEWFGRLKRKRKKDQKHSLIFALIVREDGNEEQAVGEPVSMLSLSRDSEARLEVILLRNAQPQETKH